MSKLKFQFISFLSVALICLFAIGCKNPTGQTDDDPLVGIWKLVEITGHIEDVEVTVDENDSNFVAMSLRLNSDSTCELTIEGDTTTYSGQWSDGGFYVSGQMYGEYEMVGGDLIVYTEGFGGFYGEVKLVFKKL